MHFQNYMPCGFKTTYVIPEPRVSGTSCDRTNRVEREPGTQPLAWVLQEPWRHELGAPLPYPWREMWAKPLKGRAAAAHF